MIPFPSEEVTPPVTKMYFAADAGGVGVERSGMTGDKVTAWPAVGPGLFRPRLLAGRVFLPAGTLLALLVELAGRS